MGQKFAAYNAQGAIIAFYDSEDSPVPDAVTSVIEITDAQWQTCLATPGYTVQNGALVAPPAPTPAQIAAQALITSALVALTTGLNVASTGTPALNGIYAVDQLSQMDIIAIETSLNAGKGFPGGTATFNYLDAGGAPHTFTEVSFTSLATAVRDYVYALKSVIAGVTTDLPNSSVTIV